MQSTLETHYVSDALKTPSSVAIHCTRASSARITLPGKPVENRNTTAH